MGHFVSGKAELYIILALLIGMATVIVGCWLSDNCWSPEPEQHYTIAWHDRHRWIWDRLWRYHGHYFRVRYKCTLLHNYILIYEWFRVFLTIYVRVPVNHRLYTYKSNNYDNNYYYYNNILSRPRFRPEVLTK